MSELNVHRFEPKKSDKKNRKGPAFTGLDAFVAKYPTKNFVLEVDNDFGILWFYMKNEHNLCVTNEIIEETLFLQDKIMEEFEDLTGYDDVPLKYLVSASKHPSVYNLGGDLTTFAGHIRDQNTEDLRKYAHGCVKVVHRYSISLDLPITTIVLVQGDALGGGFEAALSANVIIAEKSAQFGLPESLFNLFPGMGAYNFLERRIGAVATECFIKSGRVSAALELYDKGIIDRVAEDGKGKQAVYEYIRTTRRQQRMTNALHRIRNMVNPVTYEQLIEITDLWVETALHLSELDLRKMERLAKAQYRRIEESLLQI